MFRARRWRFLLNIIDRLPSNSRYAEAVADDDEAAEAFLKSGIEQPTSASMRLSDWSAEVAEMRVIAERMATLVSAIVAVNGGTPPKFPPLPRPFTASDRVKRRLATEQHRRLVSMMIRSEPGEG